MPMKMHLSKGREANTRWLCERTAVRCMQLLQRMSCWLKHVVGLACCLWQHADLCTVLPAWLVATLKHRGLRACQATIRDLKDVRTGALYIAASQTVGVYDMPRLVGVPRHCLL